ncbi:MAG: type III glutamate--ammonia ligase [Rhodocyclaceae bacterium]
MTPTVADTIRTLREQGVHSLFAQFADIHGIPKGKFVPLERLGDVVEHGAGFAGPSIWGTGLPRHGASSEYYGRAVLESVQAMPWMPGYARVVLDGFVAGAAFECCPRQVLKRQVARLAARGWRLNVGIEPEFFLFRRDPQGRPLPLPLDPLDTLDKPSYDYQTLSRGRDFFDRLIPMLESLGFGLEQIDHEDANGQFEINYRHDHALAAADRLMLFKMAAHGVAEQLGLVFSLMPKPFADQPGSGLHFHLSLEDEAGRMVMADPAAGERLHLSVPGQQFLAGLLHHAGALTALCAPTVNSYKRPCAGAARSGSTWVPGLALYGDNNRSTLARITASRVEWRVPDGTCNPYLGIAAIIAAGLDGVERALDPGEPVLEDVGEWSVERHASYAGARLPATLAEAIAALEADERLRAALGEPVCAQFMTIKRQEWTDYRRRISEWEFAHTLSRY